jgi:hypothetical protein
VLELTTDRKTQKRVGRTDNKTQEAIEQTKEDYFDKSSFMISKLVNKCWFIRYPCCKYVIYDNGSKFKLHFEDLCDSYGQKRKPTSIKNPQANAILERLHDVLMNMIQTQRVNTGVDKTKKQVLISHYQQMHAQASMRKLSVAGKLWEDADFDSMKMDPFCREIKDSLAAEETTEQPVRVLRLWQERWELEKLGPQGNSILEARLTKKYQGLKFWDIDNDNKVMTNDVVTMRIMCLQ